ncbi:helix-turn-helix domain-containing protein [Natronomonas sp. F2-12]|jgi:DNA-binding transcriptional ArsR family regulator|uniref:Helix-turn-helix domain-containing protein n=1 Tax=Natronomonas aquatica TaxID=2841590 RepID=A0A9R1CPH6_9EURY|nr:helix-turn-helix domain-containing protein [Natronomonas aquatica]MCQ4332659.1 helix-turn-helix domain-containing protein [Natronomonas aquatica]
MSAQLRPKGDEPAGVDRERGSVDTEAVLTALEDPDCRALLEATAEEPLTAGELTDRCEIPRSTTYRKVERLAEAGLLEERVRISADGKHASEYRRTFEDVTVSLSEADGITVGLSGAADPEAAD